MLSDADLLIITFGTAYVYRYIKTNEVVCNCHKIPNSEFKRELLDPATIVNEYSSLLKQLKASNQKLKIMFTVSPVRHWKDGAHGNQVSKATLLLAINQLCRTHPEDVFYFPSYELLMDELRDYRYYATDMIHLNNTAVQFIWEKFSQSILSDESFNIIKKIDPLLNLMQHTPLHTDTEAYRKFQDKKEKLLEKLKSDYAWLQWANLF